MLIMVISLNGEYYCFKSDWVEIYCEESLFTEERPNPWRG